MTGSMHSSSLNHGNHHNGHSEDSNHRHHNHNHEGGSSKRPRDDTGGLTLQHCPSLVHTKRTAHKKGPEDILAHLTSKHDLRDAKVFRQAKEAVAYAESLYDESCQIIKAAIQEFADGGDVAHKTQKATYPLVATHVDIRDIDKCRGSCTSEVYGTVKEAGYYGITMTRFDVMRDYCIEQLSLLIERYDVALVIGRTNIPIPLPFVVENNQPHDISSRRQFELHENFTFPDLTQINDELANGTAKTNMAGFGGMKPMSLFSAERVDLGLQRLAHYCATTATHFQGFILLTNYQRYIDEFIVWGRTQVQNGGGYTCLLGPNDTVLAATGDQAIADANNIKLPQMPAYHLLRDDKMGISIINIGVGPSNAKTITDHLAVLRPHCWIMLGHCAGLRFTQNIGDYVLAHAYVREDHVLDQDLPLWVPLPPIAEIQNALEAAMRSILAKGGEFDLRNAMRTGTLLTTDNRDWELRSIELRERFKQSRAIAVDMESATLAANGFRFRVPYGTLLCVSDKPIHGEIKLKGMANAFYSQRVAEHLHIGLEAVRLLREAGTQRLHSRKLRGFDECSWR